MATDVSLSSTNSTTTESGVLSTTKDIAGIVVDTTEWAASNVKLAASSMIDFYKESTAESKANESNTHHTLGLPPMFNENADPGKRAYKKFIMADSRVISITPGRPLFFRAKPTDGDVYKSEDFMNQIGAMDGEKGIVDFLTAGFRNQPDFRYYGFQADMADFMTYANLMITTVYSRMKVYNKAKNGNLVGSFTDEYSAKLFSSGFSMLLNKGATITEVASNDFGSSKLDSLAKSASGLFKEMRYILGNTKGTQTAEELAAQNETVQGQMADVMDSGGVLDSVLGMGNIGGVDKMGTLVNGSHLLFPHVWNDSVFDRSYNLTFKFTSPYGDGNSIFRSIYIPFLALLALSLPRQDSYMGYFSPFIMRMDVPGFFNSDMAVITSLSWRKGGSEDLFTKDGLPLEMEVSMTIRDLYPVLMMTKSYESIKASNIGFGYFLDNLAGVGIDDFNVMAGVHGWLSRKLSSVVSVPDKIVESINDSVLFKVVNMFK